LAETRAEEEMILGVRERLLEAVQLRLRADAPVGIYLSGGIDSAIIAGMAVHLAEEKRARDRCVGITLTKQRITCLGFGFEEGTDFDEMR
jgi:asparagine synthase (glutamine-hydrolysing)